MNIKKLGFVSVLALMGAMSGTTAYSVEFPEDRADVNGDGYVKSSDAMLVLQYSVGSNLSNTSWINSETTGDVNCDGKVTTTDAMLIFQYSVGYRIGSGLSESAFSKCSETDDKIELIYSPYEIDSYVPLKTWKHYKITQKPDHILEVNLSNLSNDIDLYVTRGSKNTTVSSKKKINKDQCIPFEDNRKSESCRLGVTNSGGYIYISIYGFDTGGNFRLSINEKYSDPNDKASYPFNLGESWRVCQGYNTKPLTHKKYKISDLRYSFDLSNYLQSTESGVFGCANINESNNVTIGKEILSPVNGKITSIEVVGGTKRELICIQDNKTGYSFLLGHMGLDSKEKINPKWVIGQSISKGDLVGYVAKQSKTGGSYAHIHISLHDEKNCSTNSIPFNTIFEDGSNYFEDGSNYQWRKAILSR